MKLRSIIFLTFAILFFAAVSVRNVAAQDQIVGGYGDISIKSKDAKKFANYAITTRSAKTGAKITLVKILKAEQQVVAGLNYRICMTLRQGRHKPYTATAVVYQDLRNKRSLSKWKKGSCTDL